MSNITALTEIKTDAELEELYRSLSIGLPVLFDQAAAWGDNVSTNRARLFFYALAFQLHDKGILGYLVAAANYRLATEEDGRIC